MTLAVNKQKKPNLIRPEDKNAEKDKFIDSGTRSKEGRRHPQTRTPSLRERERERERGGAKLETTHHPLWLSSTPLRKKRLSRKTPNTPLLSSPLLSAFVTSDWPRARKSNNPTTIKHRKFFYFLISYQHVYKNPVIGTFYLFVFNTIVKIFTCLRVLCFCNCFFFLFCFFLSLQPYANIIAVSQYWRKIAVSQYWRKIAVSQY